MPKVSVVTLEKTHKVSQPAGYAGLAEALAYYDDELFVINFKELPPNAEQAVLEHNASVNTIFTSEAILPDGTKRTLSYVDHFNFNWMTNYIYDDDAAPVFPKGTIIHVTAFYDNTKANKNNPDPEQWVGYGDRTVDEMAHAWINIVYMKDEDFKAEQEKRKAAATTASAAQQQQ